MRGHGPSLQTEFEGHQSPQCTKFLSGCNIWENFSSWLKKYRDLKWFWKIFSLSEAVWLGTFRAEGSLVTFTTLKTLFTPVSITEGRRKAGVLLKTPAWETLPLTLCINMCFAVHLGGLGPCHGLTAQMMWTYKLKYLTAFSNCVADEGSGVPRSLFKHGVKGWFKEQYILLLVTAGASFDALLDNLS